jgi:hypothetical protein
MVDQLPSDADGDALRRLISDGSDLSKPMAIDFAVLVPNREVGLAYAIVVEPLGFRVDVKRGGATGRWTCYCSRTMVPSYEAMISTQELLEELGRPYGAKPDGWGSFGNAPE